VAREQAPQDPDEAARARRLVNTTFLLILGGLVIQFFPAPASSASLAFAVVALLVALRALFVGRRARADRTTLLAAGVLVFAATSGLFVGATSLMLLPAQMDYQRCQAGALTEVGKQSCTQTYDKAVDKLQQQLQGPSLRP